MSSMHAAVPIPSPLRGQALRLLEGRGMLLDLARQLSGWLSAEGVDGRVVGGVAVVLHGYVQTTLDLDLHTKGPDRVSAILLRNGARSLDLLRRGFDLLGIPVHLVLPEQSGPLGHDDMEIDGVRTLDRGDLMTLKPRPGTASVRRTRDLADRVELIQRRGLTKKFAARLGRDQRAAFRKLVDSIDDEAPSPSGNHR